MELKKALELQVQHYGRDGTIKVDENGYICLNDLALYYPNKRVDNWMRLDSTIDLIKKVDEFLITSQVSELKPSVIAKRGKYKSGTYAHELVAMDFAAWLSVEFKLQVYQSFINGTQTKQNWNMKRILAADNFKMMCEAIKNDHEEPKHYHYSNEVKMINAILFNDAIYDRELADESGLELISWAERTNATLIEYGLSYQERKESLAKMYAQKITKLIQ